MHIREFVRQFMLLRCLTVRGLGANGTNLDAQFASVSERLAIIGALLTIVALAVTISTIAASIPVARWVTQYLRGLSGLQAGIENRNAVVIQDKRYRSIAIGHGHELALGRRGRDAFLDGVQTQKRENANS
jgi:hypothetical protein